MKISKSDSPPYFALKLFRWFCNPELQEEIEGDLLEYYSEYVQKFGKRKADIHFCKEVILLFRTPIVGSIHHLIFNPLSEMKKLHWIPLIALNGLMALCILLPFLPGPYDSMALALSVAAQLTGYVGLLLVPIGILWLIQEIKKLNKDHVSQNNWSNGYYFAITATCICTALSLFLALALLLNIGVSLALITTVIILIILKRTISNIKALKFKTHLSFNAVPLYLISIPIIAFTVSSFFVSPLSTYSRNYAMKQAQEVIAIIENYRNQQGNYPPSIEFIPKDKPSIMGIDKYIYEINGDGYNLSFVQHQHLGATREVVMYNKNDEQNIKGYFANYDTNQPHWKYFWLD